MSNSSPVGPLVILGDALIGETLTARPNGIKDADGINYSTQAFQWFRDGEPITDATQQTYLVTGLDANSQISVQYTYIDNLGTQETVISDPEPAVPDTELPTPTEEPETPVNPGTSDPNNSAPEGNLTVLGAAVVDYVIIARPDSISDADGIDETTKSFQWLRDGEPIPDATGPTYVVTSADAGAQLSVHYMYRDNLGNDEVVVGSAKRPVPGNPPVPPTEDTSEDDRPTDSDGSDSPADHVNSVPIGKLVILGFPVEGADMLARTDAVFDRDGFDESGASFQWLRDGEPIPGATGQIYRITQDDRGASLSVEMSFVDGAGTLETVVSEPEPSVPDPDAPTPPVDEGGQGSTPRTGGLLEGTAGNDTDLTATAALDRIDGLGGVDTAFFAGDQANYTISFSPDGVTVTDRSDGGLGTIELDNVELIDFGTDLAVFNGAMDLRQFGGHTQLDEAAFESFVEMYIAYFNRAPDAVGLAFWGTAYADGMSLEEIATEFAEQPETLQTYASDTSNIKFAAEVYQNVLGRAPDIDGLRFWTKALDNGEVTRGEFILEVLRGVDAAPPAGSSQAFIDRQLADQQYLEQKTDLGALFAVHRGMSNTDDAAQVMALFDGSAESLTSAVEAIETLYMAAIEPMGGDFLMPLMGVLDDPFVV
ncbi:DUF4214 domain-containing protein [Marivita sp.]|uniref:DUF4214 domain-containing protein n=1 Tax=Marivita sp. TaxID=2003365 RepID=UPI003F703228